MLSILGRWLPIAFIPVLFGQDQQLLAQLGPTTPSLLPEGPTIKEGLGRLPSVTPKNRQLQYRRENSLARRVELHQIQSSEAAQYADDLSPPCVRGLATEPIADCINAVGKPRTCETRVLQELGQGHSLCDRDEDGLGDDLEDALARAYAPAFAFNEGDGGNGHGKREPHWPSNAAHFLDNARLVWRHDALAPTTLGFPSNLSLDDLADAAVLSKGHKRKADDPALYRGSDFWLCLRKDDTGAYSQDALVSTMEASQHLHDGIDVTYIVHPTSPSTRDARYAVVTSYLFYAYNQHSGFADHEGDWEGVSEIIDLNEGTVVGVYFGRHDSVNNDRFQLAEVRNQAGNPTEDTTPVSSDICNKTDTARVKGIRYWDDDGLRHHVVVYVAAGGHASYSYPGNTKLMGAPGCNRWLSLWDHHNGDGPLLLPWSDSYYDAQKRIHLPVIHGIRFLNVGEPEAPFYGFARFRGQWGCDHGLIGRAWPGPFGNARHARAVTSHIWGSVPPFSPP